MTITAYFGIDDDLAATLACVEAADVCALTGDNIVTATATILEAVDAAVVDGGVLGNARLVIQEFGDIEAMYASITQQGSIVATEAADTCRITAIAPTSIIGHGKKYHVRPHDPKSIVPAS